MTGRGESNQTLKTKKIRESSDISQQRGPQAIVPETNWIMQDKRKVLDDDRTRSSGTKLVVRRKQSSAIEEPMALCFTYRVKQKKKLETEQLKTELQKQKLENTLKKQLKTEKSESGKQGPTGSYINLLTAF